MIRYEKRQIGLESIATLDSGERINQKVGERERECEKVVCVALDSNQSGSFHHYGTNLPSVHFFIIGTNEAQSTREKHGTFHVKCTFKHVLRK